MNMIESPVDRNRIAIFNFLLWDTTLYFVTVNKIASVKKIKEYITEHIDRLRDAINRSVGLGSISSYEIFTVMNEPHTTDTIHTRIVDNILYNN